MVWHSSESSIQNREISFLAILEIVFATFLYWGIAFYYDFYLHIITSIIFAPFLLLKSKDSIYYILNKSVNIFSEYSIGKFSLKVKIQILISSITVFSFLYFRNEINDVFKFFFVFGIHFITPFEVIHVLATLNYLLSSAAFTALIFCSLYKTTSFITSFWIADINVSIIS